MKERVKTEWKQNDESEVEDQELVFEVYEGSMLRLRYVSSSAVWVEI